MRRNILACTCMVCLVVMVSFGQRVGINNANPHPSASLDISSTNSGLLIPRMSSSQRTLIINPATGLMVFDTNTNSYWLRQPGIWVELANMSHFTTLKSLNGSAVFDTISMDKHRYMWELDASFPFGYSVPIPDTITSSLCGDGDGCRITVPISEWAPGITESASISGTFYYGALSSGLRRWRLDLANSTASGIDGDGNIGHIVAFNGMAYFTDGNYSGGSGADGTLGLNFLRWNGGFASSTICRLVMED